MSGKKIMGVLEHVIFELMEKKLAYEINYLGKDNGYLAQIIVKVKKKDLFIYIVKNEKTLSYSISEKGGKRKRVSKQTLLEKIKRL